MPSTVSTDEVRRLVVEQFTAYLGAVDEGQVEETILIRNGCYRGRSYRTADVMAMWFAEIGLVQFYSAEGQMLGTFSLDTRPAEAAPVRRAA